MEVGAGITARASSGHRCQVLAGAGVQPGHEDVGAAACLVCLGSEGLGAAVAADQVGCPLATAAAVPTAGTAQVKVPLPLSLAVKPEFRVVVPNFAPVELVP